MITYYNGNEYAKSIVESIEVKSGKIFIKIFDNQKEFEYDIEDLKGNVMIKGEKGMI